MPLHASPNIAKTLLDAALLCPCVTLRRFAVTLPHMTPLRYLHALLCRSSPLQRCASLHFAGAMLYRSPPMLCKPYFAAAIPWQNLAKLCPHNVLLHISLPTHNASPLCHRLALRNDTQPHLYFAQLSYAATVRCRTQQCHRCILPTQHCQHATQLCYAFTVHSLTMLLRCITVPSYAAALPVQTAPQLNVLSPCRNITLQRLANALLRCTMPMRDVASLYIRHTTRSLTVTTPCIASLCHALTTLSDTPPPPRSTCRTLATPG